MEAARTSETLVNIHLRTRQYIPEDSDLHTRRRENLKSHTGNILSVALRSSEIKVTVNQSAQFHVTTVMQ
jgi:hypothetical protein